ncbi:hypothetical protein TNCV_2829131 [Trichonephila clavipes]|nr:hypothetical protein TNCV_2829131 [Trichonephila clavipes]
MERSYLFFSSSLVARTYDVSNEEKRCESTVISPLRRLKEVSKSRPLHRRSIHAEFKPLHRLNEVSKKWRSVSFTDAFVHCPDFGSKSKFYRSRPSPHNLWETTRGPRRLSFFYFILKLKQKLIKKVAILTDMFDDDMQKCEATWELLTMDLVLLNYPQVTRTTSELATFSKLSHFASGEGGGLSRFNMDPSLYTRGGQTFPRYRLLLMFLKYCDLPSDVGVTIMY